MSNIPQASYKSRCDNCECVISVVYPFCPWCKANQQRPELSEADDATVEVRRETLQALRSYADAYGYEYGDQETYEAIVEAGIALGLDDPSPTYSIPNHIDLGEFETKEVETR